MENYVSQQMLFFFRAIALGLSLGLVYDLMRVLRRLGGGVWGGVLDVLYCLGAAAAVFFFMMAGDGELRIFMVLGAGGGAVLFLWLLGPLLRPVWAFWLRLLLFPARLIRRLLKKCGRFGKKVFSFWRNWGIITSNKLRRRLCPPQQEGELEMEKSPQSAAARPPGGKSAGKKKRASRRRPGSRLTVLLLAVLLVGLGIQIYRMLDQLQSARAEEVVYAQRLAELQETNRQLQEDLDNREDIGLIEDIARDELGMVVPGEKVFHFSK